MSPIDVPEDFFDFPKPALFETPGVLSVLVEVSVLSEFFGLFDVSKLAEVSNIEGGVTFKEVSCLKEVGLKQQDRVLSEKVKKNTYVIGAGTIENAAGNRVISLTPYNPTNDTITVADAVIGGCDVGEYSYSKISKDVLDLNIEVGGIKLGSSLEDIVKVFGETTDVYESESLGYKKYTYKSKEVYRKFEFSIDKNGKLSEIYFQNLVYNK